MVPFQTVFVLIFVHLPVIQTIENAREVEGGVELLQKGPVELIIPDLLSFTLKCQGEFSGQLRICYSAKTTTTSNQNTFYNQSPNCPPDFCFLSVFAPNSANALTQEFRGNNLYNKFHDNTHTWCPRNVVNNRQNFTVLELPPHCPVIVNGAKLPKEQVAESKSNLKWIIIVCVFIVLLLLVVIGVGLCFYLRSK